MTDIAKCADFRCPSRANCYRFTAPSSPEQSFADFMRAPNELGCDQYLHVTDKEKRQKLSLARVAV